MCSPLSSPKSDRDFQAEDDHRTMMRAAEITGDRKRMAGVRRHNGKEQKRLALVQRSVLQPSRR
jgi:hypothetical protein